MARRTVVGGGSLTTGERVPTARSSCLSKEGPGVAILFFKNESNSQWAFTSSLSPHPLLWRYICYSGVKSAWPGLPLQEEGVGGEEGEAGSGPQATPNITYVQGPD